MFQQHSCACRFLTVLLLEMVLGCGGKLASELNFRGKDFDKVSCATASHPSHTDPGSSSDCVDTSAAHLAQQHALLGCQT